MFTLTACIEDGFTTAPSDQPRMSLDTLHMGTVFSAEPTPTKRFTVHNPHSKQISISDISLSGPDAACFRLNVDGISGQRFAEVPIRGGDSIFVLVEGTFPEGANPLTRYTASLDFTTNGVRKSVTLCADAQNVRRLRGHTILKNTKFDPTIPYQIFDSLVVPEGRTLTLPAGTKLCFHDKARLIVHGSLRCQGTPEAPVSLSGDRVGEVIKDVSFDIMSRQWDGIYFSATSDQNTISHTSIRNTVYGIIAVGYADVDYTDTPQLSIINSQLRNSGGFVLEAYYTGVQAVGCEFGEAANGLVYLEGGSHAFNHCTFSNHYLFTALRGPAIQFGYILPADKTEEMQDIPLLRAEFTNSIIAGLGTELSHPDLKDSSVYFRRCLLKSEGSDDDNFINCIWGKDPLYYTVREKYIFDYRLKPESPAIGQADVSLSRLTLTHDFYGLPLSTPSDLGAYVFAPPSKE